MLMQVCCVVEITACGMNSDFSSVGQKHIAEFYMFYVGERITSGKHLVQTADQSAWLWKGQLKEGQTKWWTLPFEWVICSFVWLCYENSKHIAIAVGRSSLSSFSEHEAVTTQGTILCIWGKVRVEARPFEWWLGIKHLVNWRSAKWVANATTHCVTPEYNAWLTAGCLNQGLQSLVRQLSL